MLCAVGLIFIFPEVGTVFNWATLPLTAAGRRFMERRFPQTPIDIDGDGVPDYFVPRHPLIFYSKNLLPSFMLNLVLQLLSSTVFLWLEDWTYFEALYHCLVTATTGAWPPRCCAS